jgi:hypothetical protein
MEECAVITHLSTAAEVMAYAEAHYNDGGWDVIVECWTLDDLRQARHLDGSWDGVLGAVDVWADRQADAINSAF